MSCGGSAFPPLGYYQGAGLASVAHALGLERLLIPGPRSYGQLEPNGTHPLLDPLWSTESTEIVHDGAEPSRWEKIQFLSTDRSAPDCGHNGFQKRETRGELGGAELRGWIGHVRAR